VGFNKRILPPAAQFRLMVHSWALISRIVDGFARHRMKNIKFIIGSTLGAIFALLATFAAVILLNRAYWSFTYSAIVLAVSAISSALCFRWAIRTGIKRPTKTETRN
jgi:uncharacterized membrane protein HdeD (DUF308 family)